MLSTIGCSSEAQQKNEKTDGKKVIIDNGFLISYEGINLSKYELDVQDFDVNEISLNHLLCFAIEECDIVLVKKLLQKGVDVNFKCEEVDDVITGIGFCKDNGVSLAKLLLSKGANINGADGDNDSFLAYAIGFDNIELVKFLIEKGADKAQRDINKNMGCLPIHGIESIKMLELLIANEFQINVTCDNGRNLLHFAAKENFKEIAKYLVEKELVDIFQEDKNGATPLDYAKKFNRSEIEEIIKKKK